MIRRLLDEWQHRREARVLRRKPIPDGLWALTLARYPFLTRRAPDDLAALRRLATLFLDDKTFHGVDGFEVTDDIAVAVAAQACLPILRLGLPAYASLRTVVMHADEVVARRIVTDEDGVVHEYDEPLVGEASVDTGQLMLTWTDVRDADLHAEGGYNVVIHEFAHLLDALNGAIDGVPGPLSPAAQQQFADVLDADYEAFCDRVDAGADTLLDPYGAEGPEEFFAVATEAFFVAPAAFRHEHPALYDQLRDYFRQDPTARAG